MHRKFILRSYTVLTRRLCSVLFRKRTRNVSSVGSRCRETSAKLYKRFRLFFFFFFEGLPIYGCQLFSSPEESRKSWFYKAWVNNELRRNDATVLRRFCARLDIIGFQYYNIPGNPAMSINRKANESGTRNIS
jgi:hypothetical protein